MTERQRERAAALRYTQLWLAAANGVRLTPPQRVAPAEFPELPLEIEFEGLTLEEQRAALAAFPGGRRFFLTADKGVRRN
jgi:hypothetical protein